MRSDRYTSLPMLSCFRRPSDGSALDRSMAAFERQFHPAVVREKWIETVVEVVKQWSCDPC